MAVLQHDADELFSVKAIGQAVDGRYSAQEIRGKAGGNLLGLFEEEVAFAAGLAADFVKGHLKGDASPAGVDGGLDTGDAQPGRGADRR